MVATRLTRRAGIVVLGLLLACATQASAQLDTASIVGTVTDQSGAVLPGVTVTATQVGTNATAVVITNDRGEFVFPNLKIGTYEVSAELAGFNRSRPEGRRAERPAAAAGRLLARGG